MFVYCYVYFNPLTCGSIEASLLVTKGSIMDLFSIIKLYIGILLYYYKLLEAIYLIQLEALYNHYDYNYLLTFSIK